MQVRAKAVQRAWASVIHNHRDLQAAMQRWCCCCTGTAFKRLKVLEEALQMSIVLNLIQDASSL